MLDRNVLFERKRMGLCLYLYEDELPELAALAGGGPFPPDPTAATAVDTAGLDLREVRPPEEGNTPTLLVRILPPRRRPG